MKGTCITLKLNTLGVAHKIIEEKVKKGDFCIDATAGRGHDTVFLAELVGEEGRVIAFDIQQDAVDSTRALLQEKGYQDRVEVFLDSHSNMDQYAEENTVDCITFNFGYLPGGDHNIFTTPALFSVQSVLQNVNLRNSRTPFKRLFFLFRKKRRFLIVKHFLRKIYGFTRKTDPNFGRLSLGVFLENISGFLYN